MFSVSLVAMVLRDFVNISTPQAVARRPVNPQREQCTTMLMMT